MRPHNSEVLSLGRWDQWGEDGEDAVGEFGSGGGSRKLQAAESEQLKVFPA